MKLGVNDTVSKISAARQLYELGKAHYETKDLPGALGEIYELKKPLQEEDDAIKALRAQVATTRADFKALSLPTPLMPIGDCSKQSLET